MFCYISFKIRQSFFDIKEFLKNLLHIMDLCFQVVVKEVLLITMQTVKTYFQLIRIRSKDSFTIHFDETFFSVNNDNKNNSDNDINN